MITISLCMIVKNEERILARCLDSISALMDEIIIVDTGSTDRTKEIASRYTNKIYDFEWKNDFSAARNFSFSKASMDYIYTADADEVLDQENFIRFQLLKQAMMSEIEIVQMKYITDSEFNTVYNAKKEYRPKLFKRIRSFQWFSPIHETIQTEPVIFESDIEILHLPESNHSKRDFSAFIHAVENGVTLPKHALIMFCKELFISGKDSDFLKVKDIFLQVISKEERSTVERENINCVLARIHRLTNNTKEFFKIALKAVALDPCSEICVELGDFFFEDSDFEEAVLWYINASSETTSIINIRTSGDIPLKKLSLCYEQLSRLEIKNNNPKQAALFRDYAKQYKKQAEEWTLPVEIL